VSERSIFLGFGSPPCLGRRPGSTLRGRDGPGGWFWSRCCAVLVHACADELVLQRLLGLEVHRARVLGRGRSVLVHVKRG
jgi:hypothetical protein